MGVNTQQRVSNAAAGRHRSGAWERCGRGRAIGRVPLSQCDAGQLDEVPHAGRDDDRLLVGVPGLVVALHLLHHKLGVAQQRVLREAVEVEAGGGHRGLWRRGGERAIALVSDVSHACARGPRI